MTIESCELCGFGLTPERARNDLRRCRRCDPAGSLNVAAVSIDIAFEKPIFRVSREKLEIGGKVNNTPTPLAPLLPQRTVVSAPVQEFPPAPFLSHHLVKIREEIIVRIFEEVPRERGLLRRSMIEELARHRPTTRSEFFRYIDPDLIAKTHPIQLDSGLDFVLATIRTWKGR